MFTNSYIARASMHLRLNETKNGSKETRLLNSINNDGFKYSGKFERLFAIRISPEIRVPVALKKVVGHQLQAAVLVLDEAECCP